MSLIEMDLDLTGWIPPVEFVLDVTDLPEKESRESTMHLILYEGQAINLRLKVKKLNQAASPPALDPVDVSGWHSKMWIVDPLGETVVSGVSGAVASGPSGLIDFFVSGTDWEGLFERTHGQLHFVTDGDADDPPDIVVDFQATSRKLLGGS